MRRKSSAAYIDDSTGSVPFTHLLSIGHYSSTNPYRITSIEMHASSIHEESVTDSVKMTDKETVDELNSEIDLTRIDTIDIENYHGLTAKTVLVYISLLFIAFAQLLNLVGAGAVSAGYFSFLSTLPRNADSY